MEQRPLYSVQQALRQRPCSTSASAASSPEPWLDEAAAPPRQRRPLRSVPLASTPSRPTGTSSSSEFSSDSGGAGGFNIGLPSLSSLVSMDTAIHTDTGDLQSLIRMIPVRKLAIWGLVVAFALQLSDFFGIVMGTFIVSFIGNSFVQSTQDSALQHIDANVRRKGMVLLYFSIIIALVTLFGVLTIPDIAREGADFVGRLQSDNIWVVLVEKTRHGLGDSIMDSLEKVVHLATSDDLTLTFAASTPQGWDVERSTQLGMAVSGMLKGYTTTAAKITGAMLSSVTKFAVQVFFSLILGFMLVWDMPSIMRGVGTLKASRLSPVYNEVAPVFTVFGQLFGKALEAQARIALSNTVLTAAGMWLLKIPGIGLLSLFVFICSFIPIAGVAISTVPIGFVALTEYGFLKLALVFAMVFGVHFVEAYFLNPAIYSASLKLHPLLVLSVLTVAEHSLGIWGLMLAVPLTVFLLDYCIRYPQSSVTEVGEKELQKVHHMLQSRDGDEDEDDMDAAVAAAAAASGLLQRLDKAPEGSPVLL